MLNKSSGKNYVGGVLLLKGIPAILSPELLKVMRNGAFG